VGGVPRQEVPESYIQTVFDVMAAEPRHRFQILTKRSARFASVARSLTAGLTTWGQSETTASDEIVLLAKRGIRRSLRLGPATAAT
jgi:protein gp37